MPAADRCPILLNSNHGGWKSVVLPVALLAKQEDAHLGSRELFLSNLWSGVGKAEISEVERCHIRTMVLRMIWNRSIFGA